MPELAISWAPICCPASFVAFPAGLLGRRFREKTLGLAGLALMVISGVALSVCDGFVAALAACIIGGIGATVAILVATKMTTDWFDGREIVLAMSLLQVSWPFSAMLALPIQALIGQSLGWPAVMMFGAIVAGAAFCAFAFISEPSERAPPAAVERSFPISFCLRSSSPARSGAR